MNWLTSAPDGCYVTVKAVPRASKTEIASADGDWLRVRLQAPPVDGKANAALAEFFAELFGCPKSSVEVVTGAASRVKRIRLRGISPVQAEKVICKGA